MKQVKASIKSIRYSQRKIEEVISLIRKMPVDDALVVLSHTPRKCAGAITKLINSAKANAVNNHKLDEKSLMIDAIYSGTRTSLKRYRPAAQGRSMPYKKVMTTIEVVINGETKAIKKANLKKPAEKQPVDKSAVGGDK